MHSFSFVWAGTWHPPVSFATPQHLQNPSELTKKTSSHGLPLNPSLVFNTFQLANIYTSKISRSSPVIIWPYTLFLSIFSSPSSPSPLPPASPFSSSSPFSFFSSSPSPLPLPLPPASPFSSSPPFSFFFFFFFSFFFFCAATAQLGPCPLQSSASRHFYLLPTFSSSRISIFS